MPPNQARGERSQDQQSNGHNMQVGSAESPSAEPQQEGAGDHSHPSAGEHAYLFTGTGTSSRSSESTVSAERALMAASAETMIR
jgi:hypothetical protein